MNKHTSHLGRLFDEAAAHYNPQPDVVRFERMLLGSGSGQQSHRRRTGFVVWSAAACFALIGGTTFAFNQQTNDDHRLAPAHSEVDDDSDSTAVKTTVYRPDKTVPDGAYSDKTTVPTLPKPTDPPTTEKKKEAPKATEPKNTEPTDTEPKPPVGEYPWSVNQVYFTCDSEPPFEVFWGTANVGDKVKVMSDYGSVKVFANEVGQWEAHVYFEGAPVGVPFQIYVYGPYNEAVFSFTYLG